MLLNVGLDHRRRPQVVRRVGSRHHPVAEAERITGPESATKNTLLKRIATQNDASQSQTSVQNLCQNASDHAQIKTGSSQDSNLASRFKVRTFSPAHQVPNLSWGRETILTLSPFLTDVCRSYSSFGSNTSSSDCQFLVISGAWNLRTPCCVRWLRCSRCVSRRCCVSKVSSLTMVTYNHFPRL